MTDTNITIYPTLVIGLGGTGTNVARYVKRRFSRTWNGSAGSDDSHQSRWEELPSVLQILAADTEPLVNKPDEEPLYYHEFAFMGKFDATRLVQNRANHHPYLDWWQWNENDIPLGYIHNGAKQLRPIGRLAYFRKYVTFKNLLREKLQAMQELPAIHEVQERQFGIAPNHRLIYIVSSVCGGTGAGMFLDVAHTVRHYVGAEASIIGLFMMPSVFEKEVRSDLQRRRIQANAYAALKELNHFHTHSNYKAHYPSEQGQIPTIGYRAFNQIFLVERTSAEGTTLSNKAAAEQMAAHMIHLTAFSHLNKDILGYDVNVTEERHSNQETGQRTYLSYSSFGVSSIVMPRGALWRYYTNRTIQDVMSRLFARFPEKDVWDEYETWRDTISKEFGRHMNGEVSLKALSDAMSHDLEGWVPFAAKTNQVLMRVRNKYGLEAMKFLCQQMQKEASGTNHRIITEPHHRPFRPVAAPPTEGWRDRFASSPEVRAEREKVRAKYLLYETQLRVWDKVLTELRTLARRREVWANDLQKIAKESWSDVAKELEEIAARIHPLRQNHDRSTSTYYDLETGVMGAEHLEQFWKRTSPLLDESFPQGNPQTVRQQLLAAIYRDPPPSNIESVIAQHLSAIPSLYQRVFEVFDFRYLLSIQHARGRRPANHRTDQLFQRLHPHASVDGDTYPYSEADQEHTRLVGVPGEPEEDGNQQPNGHHSGQAFDQSLRGYSQFRVLETEADDRIDACHIVHGLPVAQLTSVPELWRQYSGEDFDPGILHLQPDWAVPGTLDDLYSPPMNGSSNGPTSLSKAAIHTASQQGTPPPTSPGSSSGIRG